MRFRVLLPSQDGFRLLFDQTEEGLSLPALDVPDGADLLDAGLLAHAASRQFGIRATVLSSHVCFHPPDQPPIPVVTIENHTGGWIPPGAYRWRKHLDLAGETFLSEFQRDIALAWFEVNERWPDVLLPWWQPGWFSHAAYWTQQAIKLRGLDWSGTIVPRKSWYLSSVFRAPSNSGGWWFKAVPPYCAQEIPLLQALNHWKVGGTTEVVAADAGLGWMLVRHVKGRSLARDRTLASWESALRQLARIQRQTVERVDDLLALGCLDLRIDGLAAQITSLFASLDALQTGLPGRLTPAEIARAERLAPELMALCAKMQGTPIPPTLVHGDCHAMNILRSYGRSIFFDWGDACVSHPFLDAMELLDSEDWLPKDRGAVRSLTDHYLSQWTEFADIDTLRTLYNDLKPLRLLTTALRRERVVRSMMEMWPPGARVRHSAMLWSLQQQQYWITLHIRALVAH
jgi:Ser/Thr protein kinase RdoA (MazF antagonist)